MANSVFPFQIGSRFRIPLLLLFSVTGSRAAVTVDDDRLHVRFGPWFVDTARDNVAKVEVTGPYRWWKAIGIRMSLVDRGITLGTTSAAGVCLQLKEPISLHLWRFTVPLRHPGLTVTVADTAGLSALLNPETDAT